MDKPSRTQLRSIAYSEFDGTDRFWGLEKVRFGRINLIVGKNASGKTRLLNVINGVASLIRRENQQLWVSGTYNIVFMVDDKKYEYSIRLDSRKVSFEKLSINRDVVLERSEDGVGKIYAEEVQRSISMKIPSTELAIYVRRDEIQHPFLEPIHHWAASVRRYEFGSEMGKRYLHHFPNDSDETSAEGEFLLASDPKKVVQLYISGFQTFGESFDKAILRDLRRIGYDCEDVGAQHLEDLSLPGIGRIPVALYVKERDLALPTRQIEMSMGMYRALALVINLNFSVFMKNTQCIVIDDIGEGLDFDRSVRLIKLLIEKARKERYQLIMSSNDRFVMNEIPLYYWHIIDRVGSNVRVLDAYNSRELFRRFKYLGLSNFDFFSMGAYRSNLEDLDSVL